MLDLIYLIVGIIVFMGIVYLCSMFETARIVFGTILVVCILTSAVFSGIKLNQYYSAEGGIYGKIENFFGVNEVETIDTMTYKLNNINFTSTINENEYDADFIIYETNELNPDIEYMVLFNDKPCSTSKVGSEFISAEYIYNFYDENENVINSDSITIKIATYKTYTYIHLITDGGTDAVKLWHSYFEKNGSILELKPITEAAE